MPRKVKERKPDTCRLTATIRGEVYAVRPLRPETGDVTRAWRITKASGTAYVVADHIDGQSCTCADYEFRHQGHDADGCKHVRALRALGLIDPEGDDPHDWPAWTDTHAFTTTR